MPKGYWIGRVDVRNEEGYKPYSAANPPIFRKFGGRFLVRAGKYECVEGMSHPRNVVIEFPDYATALACYHSPEYQANINVRRPHASADVAIAEGYDGPQLTPSASAPASSSKKGYLVAHVDVTDAEGHKAYAAATIAPFVEYGVRYIVRGGKREMPEGRVRANTLLIEFPSFDAALACYRSPGYQAALKLREGKAIADLVLAEGYDGPQP
jgi:uncharacterized protein (DUF1330 family)